MFNNVKGIHVHASFHKKLAIINKELLLIRRQNYNCEYSHLKTKQINMFLLSCNHILLSSLIVYFIVYHMFNNK